MYTYLPIHLSTFAHARTSTLTHTYTSTNSSISPASSPPATVILAVSLLSSRIFKCSTATSRLHTLCRRTLSRSQPSAPPPPLPPPPPLDRSLPAFPFRDMKAEKNTPNNLFRCHPSLHNSPSPPVRDETNPRVPPPPSRHPPGDWALRALTKLVKICVMDQLCVLCRLRSTCKALSRPFPSYAAPLSTPSYPDSPSRTSSCALDPLTA